MRSQLTRTFTVWMVLAVVAAGHPGLAHALDLGEKLSNFVRQYLDLTEVELHWDVTARFHVAHAGDNVVADGEPTLGTFSFWSRAAKYRQDMYMEPARYTEVDTSIAFNGSEFQVHRRDLDSLAFGAGDQTMFGMGLPNPLTEVLQFLYPLTDDNWMHEIKLQTVQSDENLWDRVAGVEWDQEAPSSAPIGYFAGGTLHGISYTYEVHFVAEGDLLLPIAIHKVTRGGTWMSTMLSDYFTAGGQWWPGVIEHTVFNGVDVVEEMMYVVTSFDSDPDFDDLIFTLDDSTVGFVWDAGAQATASALQRLHEAGSVIRLASLPLDGRGHHGGTKSLAQLTPAGTEVLDGGWTTTRRLCLLLAAVGLAGCAFSSPRRSDPGREMVP